jgi:hypothetical protein
VTRVEPVLCFDRDGFPVWGCPDFVMDSVPVYDVITVEQFGVRRDFHLIDVDADEPNAAFIYQEAPL